MTTNSIYYEKCFPLGGYSNEKIGIKIDLTPEDNPLDAFADAKKHVEKSHKFFQDTPAYEQAKKIVANPDDYTGRDVKAAQQAIELFEANYPEYIAKFFIPVSRQLNMADDSKPGDDLPY
jgi:hypothetical protein